MDDARLKKCEATRSTHEALYKSGAIERECSPGHSPNDGIKRVRQSDSRPKTHKNCRDSRSSKTASIVVMGLPERSLLTIYTRRAGAAGRLKLKLKSIGLECLPIEWRPRLVPMLTVSDPMTKGSEWKTTRPVVFSKSRGDQASG